jgi:sulfur-carrier protein
MVKILFFAQIRELLGTSSLELAIEGGNITAEALRAQLASTDEKWAKVMSSDKLLVAINQTMSTWDACITDGDEVAFFPPVTGG